MAIVITPGEPAGIGPDICLQLMSQEQHSKLQHLGVLICDPDLLQQRAGNLGQDITIEACDDWQQAVSSLDNNSITVLRTPLYQPVKPGQLDAGNAQYVLDCLDQAIALCSTGKADAMVTGPVHKGIINQAGHTFSGHTEYLAAPSSSQPVMMLATDVLRVVLATTHLPLRDVSDNINADMLSTKLTITHNFLRDAFRIKQPRIQVCGLNPHAGEEGHLGNEEIDIIEPVISRLVSQGLNLVGPVPADTAFNQDLLPDFDAIFAMYHDQGLPVLKHSGFGKAVNITMGLPFIRTSVDHGTALDLAASGEASSDSLIAAINSALELSQH